MAPTIASNHPSQPGSKQLTRYLQEKYNMPDDEWWANVETTFGHLQSVLERRPSRKSEEENDPESISAHAARAGALPVVTLIPSGSHALQLTATDEDLACVAFGTISTQLYVEIFWELVAKVQDEDGNFVVYKVEERLGCFWFGFEGHDFQLLSVQCEDLVRRYPDILNVPDAVLQDLDAHTQGVVEGIRRSMRERTYFDESEPARKAFHYLRAFTIARGIYTNQQSLISERTFRFQELVKIVNPESQASRGQNQENSVLTMSHYVSDFFNNLNVSLLFRRHSVRPAHLQDPEIEPTQLLRVLRESESESMNSKFGMIEYIQVKVAYWGGSDLACGRWLSMVECRLSKLKDRLETTDPRPSMVCTWPQRLVGLENDGTNDGDFYEGCYVVGLYRLNEIPESSATASIAQRWTVQVEGDNETTKEDCSIRAVCMLAKEFENMKLRPCTRQWPRPVVAVDPEKNHRDKGVDLRADCVNKSKKASKHQKSEELNKVEISSHEPHRKLRPASDVLRRLKHDRSLNIDKFKVGYVDRHTDRIQEKPAMAWVRETTNEEWIPEHRIVYFKRVSKSGEEQLMWDKASKIDRIFKENGNVE